ncbi:rho GTPase-activating protein 18-like [Physella acuta]|uniref:rho GTPase-activating protein 18-like n=1 Tax=Physella acuta TaxID=109671 RepID=UPI0027DBE9C0|nr:rho GTPase-activating protein 18-like [Physella acuta]
MVLFSRICVSPAAFRHFVAGTNSLISKDVSRCLMAVHAISDRDKFQELSRTPKQDGATRSSAKSLKYWNGLQCQTRGLFGQCRTGGLAVLKQALKPGVSNTCWVPSAGYCDVPAYYNALKDDTGLTFMGDFSTEDQELIQRLAYNELKNMMDKHQLPYKKSSHKNHKFHKIFGSSLQSIVEHEAKLGFKHAPFMTSIVVMELVRILMIGVPVSVFDIPGLNTKAIKEEINEKFYTSPVNLKKYGPQEVASVLKCFLEELKEPLLSVDHLESFPPISKLHNIHRLQILNYLYMMMRVEHRDTLQMLSYLCQHICHNRQTQVTAKMVAASLHTAIGYFPDTKNASTFAQMQLENELYTQLYFDYHDKLWVVPPELVKQLRQLYVSGKATVKPSKFPWFKKVKFDGEKVVPNSELASLKEMNIMVQAPHLPKTEQLVRVDGETKAIEVVAYFDTNANLMRELSTTLMPKNLNMRLQQYNYLYEVGGNIGSRCIDPNAKVLEIFKINPDAGFVVQPGFGR